MTDATTIPDGPAKPMPRLWARVSLRTGTTIQTAATAVGVACLYGATHLHASRPAQLALLALGWLAIYLDTHAIAHVAVGRAVGIGFRGYGIRGTDHPENYPPGIRQVMSVLPMWCALTDKTSMRTATRWSKATMFAAGETATTIASIAAAGYAARAGLPGGRLLFSASVLWAIASTLTVAIVPKGDYTKALCALGWRQQATAATTSRQGRARFFDLNRPGGAAASDAMPRSAEASSPSPPTSH